jgi:hypothetical protein
METAATRADIQQRKGVLYLEKKHEEEKQAHRRADRHTEDDEIVNVLRRYGVPVTGRLTNKVMSDFLRQQRHHIGKQRRADLIASIRAFMATHPSVEEPDEDNFEASPPLPPAVRPVRLNLL